MNYSPTLVRGGESLTGSGAGVEQALHGRQVERSP